MIYAYSFHPLSSVRYTYGKPVKGSARVKICVKQEYYTSSERPCASLQKRVSIIDLLYNSYIDTMEMFRKSNF